MYQARMNLRFIECSGGIWHARTVIAVFVFLLGLIEGSFLNVCIVRIPAGKSVVRPSSKCPKCGKGVRPYDNVPVLGWLWLRGKCRDCKAPISPLYPVVELLTGLLFLGCYLAFGLTLVAAKWAVFASLLVVLTATDIRERILPDKVNLFGAILGLVLSAVVPPADGSAAWLAGKLFDFPPPRAAIGVVDGLFGAAVGAGLLWLVGEGYFRLRGREGMGLGDVKMMGMVGIFLGVKRTLLTVLFGSLLGSVIGVAVILATRKRSDYELPFGAFLAAGALLVVYFGTPALSWYQSLLGAR
jgi:leader peptidase (prepilin peptidase)/N-methyltransferase